MLYSLHPDYPKAFRAAVSSDGSVFRFDYVDDPAFILPDGYIIAPDCNRKYYDENGSLLIRFWSSERLSKHIEAKHREA
jgi:hypothetical protein